MGKKKIMTVRGPIEPAALGLTSMHDHIMFNGSVLGKRLRGDLPEHNLPIHEDDKVSLENVGILQRNTILAWDALNQDDEAMLTAEVADFKAAGGEAILELSVPGILLDTEANRRISAATDVHIIISTGFYTEDSWPEQYRGLSTKEYREHMLFEVEHGVNGTDIKPGHLKIGLLNLSADEEKTLRAAAQVANETGLSLTVHPCRKPGGDFQRIISILKEEGMNLERLVMAHTPLLDAPPMAEVIRQPERYRVNTDRAKYLLDTGCTISTEFLNPMCLELLGEYNAGDWAKMSGLISLINQGYCQQIVTGNDCCGKIMLKRCGGEGFCRMLYFTIPTLREVAGVSEYALKHITVENPRRILAY